MKILLVLDTYYPKVDGPATVIHNLATILTQRKLADITILAPKYPKYEDHFDYKVIRCTSMIGPDKYRTGLPALTCGLEKRLKKEKFDLIHVHSPFTLGKYAINFGKKHKIPTINTIHTKYRSDFERKLNSKILIKFMMKYIKGVMNKSDYISTVSSIFAKELKTDYGCKKHSAVIRNATEFQNINIDKKEILELKHKLNISKEFVFLFVGRVVANKNIQFSLKSLAELKSKGINNFKFVIVGEGNYIDKLQAQAKSLGISDKVIFVGLVKDRHLLSTYYAMADLFLFPSFIDTCGLVVLEAGSFGTPSMVLSNTSASESIENNYNGFVVDKSPSKWAEVMNNIIKNKYNLSTISENTLRTLNKSWNEITMEYYHFYQSAILAHKMKQNIKKIFVNLSQIKPISTHELLSGRIYTFTKRPNNKILLESLSQKECA